jgi:hypothetical protein
MTDTTIDTIEARAKALNLQRADRLPFDWTDQAYDLDTAYRAYVRRRQCKPNMFFERRGYVYVWRDGA